MFIVRIQRYAEELSEYLFRCSTTSWTSHYYFPTRWFTEDRTVINKIKAQHCVLPDRAFRGHLAGGAYCRRWRLLLRRVALLQLQANAFYFKKSLISPYHDCHFPLRSCGKRVEVNHDYDPLIFNRLDVECEILLVVDDVFSLRLSLIFVGAVLYWQPSFQRQAGFHSGGRQSSCRLDDTSRYISLWPPHNPALVETYMMWCMPDQMRLKQHRNRCLNLDCMAWQNS